MFRSRWNKASPAEQDLVVAIAQSLDDGGVSSAADYSRILGKSATQLSSARRSLMDKGIVEPVRRGFIRFSLPGFAEYVLAQVAPAVESGGAAGQF
jgi:DNA-binding transcriptional ArsR family regulator